MKCFVVLDEATLLRLWMRNPELVQPFSRPFYPVRRRLPAANDARFVDATGATSHGATTTEKEPAETSR